MFCEEPKCVISWCCDITVTLFMILKNKEKIKSAVFKDNPQEEIKRLHGSNNFRLEAVVFSLVYVTCSY
jgi:hypothetical protein